jgi:hypothetical protein
MITSIDGYLFATCQGTVQLARRSTSRFVSAATQSPGVQVAPSMSTPFELRLTKYIPPALGQANVEYQLDQIGKIVLLRNNGIDYIRPPYRLRFVVLAITIDDSRAIVHASGYTGQTSYSMSPAWRIISRWTLQAVTS